MFIVENFMLPIYIDGIVESPTKISSSDYFFFKTELRYRSMLIPAKCFIRSGIDLQCSPEENELIMVGFLIVVFESLGWFLTSSE